MNYGVKEEEKITKVRFCIFYKLKWVLFSILSFKSSPINFSFGNVSLLGWRDGSLLVNCLLCRHEDLRSPAAMQKSQVWRHRAVTAELGRQTQEEPGL